MLDRLVVHIGHERTGVGALQKTFAANNSALRAAGICYPLLPRRGARSDHDAVSIEFGGRGGPFAPGRQWKRFFAVANDAACPVTILSSQVPLRLAPANIAQAMNTVAKLARCVDVLIYVRHPIHHANSAVSQRLREGQTLEEVFRSDPVVPFCELIGRWRDGLAASGVPGRLVVRPYRRDTEPEWSVVDDVLAVTGQDVAASALRCPGAGDTASLSALGVYLLDSVNRNAPANTIVRSSLSAYGAIKGPSYVLPDHVRQRIREQVDGPLRWLRETHGVMLHERDQAQSGPCPLTPDELDSLALVTLSSTQFAFELERSRIGRFVRYSCGTPATAAKRLFPQLSPPGVSL